MTSRLLPMRDTRRSEFRADGRALRLFRALTLFLALTLFRADGRALIEFRADDFAESLNGAKLNLPADVIGGSCRIETRALFWGVLPPAWDGVFGWFFLDFLMEGERVALVLVEGGLVLSVDGEGAGEEDVDLERPERNLDLERARRALRLRLGLGLRSSLVVVLGVGCAEGASSVYVSGCGEAVSVSAIAGFDSALGGVMVVADGDDIDIAIAV